MAKKKTGEEKDRKAGADGLDTIVERIHESYMRHEEMNNMDGALLPSKAVIREMAEDFMGMVFPGFYSKESVDRGNAEGYIRGKCLKFGRMLAEEIEKGVRYNCKVGRMNCALDKCGNIAELVARQVLESIPGIRDMAHADVHAAFDADPAAQNIFEVVLSYPGIEALTIHRLAHLLYYLGVPFIPRMFSEYVHGKTGIDINPGAKIGTGISIDHGTGVVIGETAVLGNNVKIFQGVTLGALSVSKENNRKRHPTIEDDVTIYSGTTILGGETVVGKGSIIGGNVWLVESVPPYSKIYIESPTLICKNCDADFDCERDDGKGCSRLRIEKEKTPENR